MVDLIYSIPNIGVNRSMVFIRRSMQDNSMQRQLESIKKNENERYAFKHKISAELRRVLNFKVWSRTTEKRLIEVVTKNNLKK